MKKLGIVITSVYALFCITLMLIIPMNKFEWMLDEPSARTEGLTFCGLPVDEDINPRQLFLAFLVPILAFGIAQSMRQQKIHYSLWIAFALLAIWGWRFFIYYPLC
ncbi:DUF2645 family protein [Variovorax sp. RO1]|uniref:DUF2645 family protein n=1 Tax=Variovorax sp. RO1 TaxID=2066034 RepID=UPI00117D0F8C|nr:DUF2645 family protein [Variovorax sp. RO1]